MNSTRGFRRQALLGHVKRAATLGPHLTTKATEAASLQDILITSKLRARRRRASLQDENIALHALARVMAESPHKLIDTLLGIALELCNAGTAGLSLLEKTPEGEHIFRWTNLAGVLRNHIGESMPRKLSPCGVSMDLHSPQLFAYPARLFQPFQKMTPLIVEALVVPVHIGDETPGTIWIFSHDEGVQFDSGDVRIMSMLADFTGCGVHLLRLYEPERQAPQRGEEEFRARISQLQQLSARLMNLQDEERRRFACELHESAEQYLAAIKMNLSILLRDTQAGTVEKTQAIREALESVDRCDSEVRAISYLLHPPLLDEMGLPTAISLFTEGFTKRSGIPVELEIPQDLKRLPRDVETTLFRVVQQSLSNIHRHSGSRLARVGIMKNNECLTVEVCDEGCGVSPEVLQAFHTGERLVGVGLPGMRERIWEMGGRFEIRTEGGTTIKVTLPLGENAAS